MINLHLKIFTLICCFCVTSIISSKLNVPRVLLPIFNDFSTKFILEVTEGDCYKWTTSRSDIIKLVPYNNNLELDCSSAVTVLTNTKERTRNMAVVLAEDVYTSQVLRCDIIVDVIDSLAIITTTREIYVDEAPEEFQVRAYDSQGNEFTSLEGVEFDWQMESTKPGVINGIRFMKFKDSPYETPSTIESFENQDKNGHIVLLSGFKTGSAKVTVKLPHKEYENIQGHEVQLSVIANLIVTPSEAYIMVGDTVCLTVFQMNNGRMENIDLSLSNYELQLENEMIASIDDSLTITGLEAGKTKVMVRDSNIAEHENGKLPACTIHVVSPAYMKLSILPHKNWAILLSEHHDIVAEVYSNEGHKLHLGSGVKIDILVGSLFHVHERSKNGSWLTGWAKDVGVTPVNSTLHGVVNHKLGTFKINPEISAHAELLIFPHIVLNPSEVLLPWDPILKPKYEVEFHAIGGDGNFLWSSSNESIGIVTQNGNMRTHYHGQFRINAAMTRNPHNMRSATIQILPPTKLEIIEYVMEAEINKPIFLYVALFATKRIRAEKNYFVPFNLCQELPFKVKFSNENFIYNASVVETPVGISCATIAVMSHSVGISKVTISYTIDGNTLEDSVTVSTFDPLKLFYPLQHQIALAVDTSINVIFTGGPKPFVGHPSIYKRTVVNSLDTIVSAIDITDKNPTNTDDVIVLHISCLDIGSSDVKLIITNNPLLTNSKNKEIYAEVNVFCVQPYSISLHPVVKVADSKSCPMDVTSNRIIVPSYKNIEVDVVIRDENDRNLLNISSIKLHWFLDSEDKAELGSPNGVFSRTITYNDVVYSNGSYQVVIPKAEGGVFKLGVIFYGYLKDKYFYLNVKDCISKENSGCIKDEVYLYLANNAIAIPNKLSIYNHPKSKKRIMIKHGSGYYEISLSSDKIAYIKYKESTHELEISPLNVGELEITLIDLCLPAIPVIISVSIVSISSIKVKMSDKVEIGKSIPAVVTLYDSFDNVISIPDIDVLQITSDLDSRIAKIDQTETDYFTAEDELVYTVTGMELGDTRIKFTIGDVVSPSVALQVFPPLRITPRNVTLLLGSVFQYSSRGGPYPDNVEYTVINRTIAGINNVGLVHTMELGHTKIEASSVGICPTTGVQIIYSKDEVDLYVIPIKSIKIMTPLTRFQVGATIPLWVSGLPDELSPMILGSTQEPIQFHWRVDDQDIIKIQNPFNTLGIEYLPEDEVVVRMSGVSTGRTTIHLDVVIPDSVNSDSYMYSDSVEIEVFKSFELTSPHVVTGKFILMTTHASMQLETNMDGIHQVTYILSSVNSTPVAVARIVDKKSLDILHPLISISDSGLVQSYNKFGTAHIMITATDQFGLRQILNIVIEVKPVHFMMLNVVTNWRVNSLLPIIKVPLGTEIKLHGHFYDNLGVQFTAANLNLNIKSSRAELISLRTDTDNCSVIVSAKKIGGTILRGFTSGFHKNTDYIKLQIGQVLDPMDENITTGDVICPSTPLVSLNKNSGQWKTSDSTLIKINSESGIGYTVGLRNGYVTLSHSLHPSTALHFSVLPATEIIIRPPSQKALTNAPEVMFQIPLVITSDGLSSKKNNLVNGRHCQHLTEEYMSYPFICYFDHNSNVQSIDNPVFTIKSGFDPNTGRYTCDLIPKIDYSPKTHYLVGNVTIWAELPDLEIKATPIVIPFIPAISVTPEIHVESSSGVLVINGVDIALDEVEVVAVDPQLLHIYSAERPKTNVLLHRFNVLSHHWRSEEIGDAMTLIVKSALTNQKIKVKVKMDSAETSGSFENTFFHSPIVNLIYQYHKHISVICSTFALLIFTLIIYSYFIQPVITVNTSGYNSPNTSFASVSPLHQTINSSRTSPSITNQPRPAYGSPEPIYGEPNSFYRSIPDIRKNRRL